MNPTKNQTKAQYLSSSLIFTAILLFVLSLTASFQTTAQSFILDIQGSTMSFTNAQRTVIYNAGNNGRDQGSIHKYANVITKDGITVDALLTIVEKNNATITNFDDDAITGEQTRFQPRIGTGTGGGYIVYELEFIHSTSNVPVFVYNYNITGVDIDGNSVSNREYVEVGGYTSYMISSTLSQLVVSTNNLTGRTRFLGRITSLDGVTFDNTAAFIANYLNANNKISFALGQSGANGERFYSVQIGIAGGVFIDPIVVNNPLPVAIDDVGTPLNGTTGGVAVNNVLDNDLYDGTAVVPSEVTITLVTAASHPGVQLNAATGQVTVVPGTPGGEYSLVYRICMNDAPSNCDIATVTLKVLEADLEISKTVNSNPAIAGESIEYTIIVTNNGPTEALNVSVEDILAAQLSVTNVTLSTGSWSAPNWTIGTINSGGSVSMTIIASIDVNFSGNINNTATVSSSTPDPNPDNNTASVLTQVVPPAGPTSNDDNTTTLINTPVTFNILSNDLPGASALDPATVTFISGTEPNPVTEGIFTIGANGEVTFTPANGFIGVVTIDYQVCDLNGFCDIATITVNVIVGATNLYPALGPGTLAFEDLWPGKGDYDFNDLVLDYQFEIISNPSNFVDQVNATFTIRAFGASYENGFGFQLSSSIDPADLTVSGYDLTDTYISLEANGTESGQSRPTIIVFDNAFDQMPHPGIGIGVNTTPDAPYVAPVTLVIQILFKPNTYSYNDLDISNFNPFLIVNKVRSHEVHLPYYPPTGLANPELFGMWEDDSNPNSGRYYVTANNLPWAINIYESFDYPKEKQDITWAHLKFAEWATSGGALFPDWYKNLAGYRNANLIYQRPNN